MSSGNLVLPDNPESFTWSQDCDPNRYILASYRVLTSSAGEEAALGMAMEQSASTLFIAGYASPDMFDDHTIRIRSVDEVTGFSPSMLTSTAVSSYSLATEVYAKTSEQLRMFDICLAVPTLLLQRKPAQLLNVLVGELPRLGFLNSFRLVDVRLPPAFGPGPSFGQQGILELLGKSSGPLLCRAMRPGVGLDLETMATINQDVLTAGFHLVKDDELICFSTLDDYRTHLTRMIRARDEAMQASGERKLYLANLMCEPDELEARWDLACSLGVDAVLVAPFIQGLGVLPALAKRKQLPLLAHNSFADLITRNPGWGIDDAVLCHWARHLGADWFVTPGPFTSADFGAERHRSIIEAATSPSGDVRAMMPNLQGGKHPEGLPIYRESVGSDNFMLIVAH
ncbi:MAG: RuBisCO large subunit C-terminal-like domain-containing protein, partial [Pseudomonadota bacterium]